MEDDQFPKFKYSKRKDGLIARSDGALVPVFDENNVVTQHFRRWEREGGKFVDHVMSKDEERFEREQAALFERNRVLEEENRKAALTAPPPLIGKK